MCVDAANCDGSCPECMSNKIRRLKMANKQLTKMCDQHLAELAAERQRARLPEELVERVRKCIKLDDTYANLILRDILAAVEQSDNPNP